MFDPYHKWLGIPRQEQPPNHYRLLGLTIFEDDPSVIETAADQRLLHLRTFQASQENAHAERLLNEVTSAKLCLLRPERKYKYDAELRLTQSTPASSPVAIQYPQARLLEPPPAAVIPIAMPIFSPVVERIPEQVSIVQDEYYSHDAPTKYGPATRQAIRPESLHRKKTLSPFVIIGPLVGVAAVAAAIVAMNSRNDPQVAASKPSRQASVINLPTPAPPRKPPHPVPILPTRPLRRVPRAIETSPQQLSRSASEPQWAAEFAAALTSPITETIPDVMQTVTSLPATFSELQTPGLSRFIPSTKVAAPIALTFEQRVDRIDGRDIPTDEQIATVAIGFIPAGAELKISAWTYKSGPGVKLVLQEQPEPIVVFLTVSRGKPGSATVRVKPWLGPPGATLGIPCSLPRLNSLLAGLPVMIDNAQAAVQSTQQQIRNLEYNLQSLTNSTSTNLGNKTANQAAMQTIRAHLNIQYAKLRTLSASINTMQARLNELPNIIAQVEGFVGTPIQYKISFTSGNQDIVVAQTDDRSDP